MNIKLFILYFFIYSFIGWVIEVIGKIIQGKGFVNRGFLVGPICPIYGTGVLLLLLIIKDKIDNPFYVFCVSFVVSGTLEYLTSFFMEKIFNVRWWDYSDDKFNLNGRICLETLIPFALGATLIIFFFQPWLSSILTCLSIKTISSLCIVLLSIFVIDIIFTITVLYNIKRKIKKLKDDATESIKEEMNKFLESNSKLYKRIRKAFEKAEIRIKKRIKKIAK